MWAREEAASRSGGPAELTHHTSERSQAALEHTPTTPDIRQRDGLSGPIRLLRIPVCVACKVWRAKAVQPRPRRGARAPPGTWAGRPGRGPGGVDTLVIRLWGFGVNPPRLCRSAKSQVLPERPRSSLYRRQRRPPFYTPLTVSATLAVTRTCPGKGAAVGSTVKMMKKMESGALAVHVEAGLLSVLP